MKLNETIAEARKRKGLTQEQLAQKLYVTRQAVSRWERGEVSWNRYAEAYRYNSRRAYRPLA